MPRVRRTLHAREDLLDIWKYIHAQNAEAADCLIYDIHNTYQNLADYPHIGRLRSEIGKDIRSFPVKKYVVYYKPLEDDILVLRVLHGTRDISALL